MDKERSAKDYAVMYYEAVQKGLSVPFYEKERIFKLYRKACEVERKEGKEVNKNLEIFICDLHTAEFNEMTSSHSLKAGVS